MEYSITNNHLIIKYGDVTHVNSIKTIEGVNLKTDMMHGPNTVSIDIQFTPNYNVRLLINHNSPQQLANIINKCEKLTTDLINFCERREK